MKEWIAQQQVWALVWLTSLTLPETLEDEQAAAAATASAPTTVSIGFCVDTLSFSNLARKREL